MKPLRVDFLEVGLVDYFLAVVFLGFAFTAGIFAGRMLCEIAVILFFAYFKGQIL